MSTVAKDTGASNPFFGSVSGTLGDIVGAVGETFTQVFPVWAARELDLQRNPDQLANPLYVPSNYSPRIDQGRLNTTSTSTEKPDPNIKKAFLDLNVGGTRVSGAAIVGGVLALIVGFWVVRKYA